MGNRLASVPELGQYKRNVQFRATQRLVAWLDAYAAEHGVSRSTLLAVAVQEFSRRARSGRTNIKARLARIETAYLARIGRTSQAGGRKGR